MVGFLRRGRGSGGGGGEGEVASKKRDIWGCFGYFENKLHFRYFVMKYGQYGKIIVFGNVIDVFV